MNPIIIKIVISILFLNSILLGQEKKDSAQQQRLDLSTRLEIERAIERGLSYLKNKQELDGFWGDSKHPAFTALVLTSALRSPSYEPSEFIEKGFAWLVKQQQKDGGIYGKGLATYNTSISILALTEQDKKEDYEKILRARAFLISQQSDWGELGKTDNKYDGGIGYGGTYKHSDLSNTYLAIEALKASRTIALRDESKKEPELNWEAAITFISRTQNLKATNDLADISNDGSFNYFPGDSKAGYQKNPDGSESLRGYGSMSYAGLLSLIYARLDSDDRRVLAVKKWIGENYTLKENPGLATKEKPELGQQGLYYYYNAMSKALSAAGMNFVRLENGDKVDWRSDLARELLIRQREDGSWVNGNSRWWESDPILVTAYALLTLEEIYTKR